MIQKLKKKYGKTLEIAKEGRADTPRIPSGVFTFDVLTGGGVPLWKTSIFHGVKSSGKTTQALRIIGNFLAMYKDKYVAYIDFENSFDKEWASHFIEEDDLDRVLVINPTYGEEGVDIAVELCQNYDNVGMLFVDSLANMISTADATKSAMDDTMGANAKLVNKLIRKILPIMSDAYKADRPFLTLFINQLTTNMGGGAFSSGVKKPGGMLQDFIAHLDVRFYFKEYKKSGEVPITGVYQIKIEKSKLKGAMQHAKGEFRMSLVNKNNFRIGQAHDQEVILYYAKKTNVLGRDGNKWTFNENVFKNQTEILDKMYDDEAFMYEIGDAVLREIYTKGTSVLGGDND